MSKLFAWMQHTNATNAYANRLQDGATTKNDGHLADTHWGNQLLMAAAVTSHACKM